MRMNGVVMVGGFCVVVRITASAAALFHHGARLIQGNALSAAADNAAEFVSLAIQKTPAGQDTRFGVWFEPLLPRLCPQREF